MKRGNNLFHYAIIVLLVIIIFLQIYSGPQLAPQRLPIRERLSTDEIYVSDMCRYQQAWLTFLQNDIETVKLQLQSINNDTIYKELALIFQSEILDYIDNNISKAIDSYLEFLELYPNSIYYDDIRLRLRELTS